MGKSSFLYQHLLTFIIYVFNIRLPVSTFIIREYLAPIFRSRMALVEKVVDEKWNQSHFLTKPQSLSRFAKFTQWRRWSPKAKGAFFNLFFISYFVAFHIVLLSVGLPIRIISCCCVIWASMAPLHGQGALDRIFLVVFKFISYLHSNPET